MKVVKILDAVIVEHLDLPSLKQRLTILHDTVLQGPMRSTALTASPTVSYTSINQREPDFETHKIEGRYFFAGITRINTNELTFLTAENMIRTAEN